MTRALTGRKIMNKLLIALTAGLLASSAVFAQAPVTKAPDAMTPAPAAADAKTTAAPATAKTVKKHKKRYHKVKAGKSASHAQADQNEAHQ
jgi:hypothetical protein